VGARVSGRGRVGRGGNDGVAVRGEISHRFVSGRDGTIQPRPQKILNDATSLSGSQTSRNRSRRPGMPVAVKVAGFALMRARCTRPRPLQGRQRQHRRLPNHHHTENAAPPMCSPDTAPCEWCLKRSCQTGGLLPWLLRAGRHPKFPLPGTVWVAHPPQKQAQSSPPGCWRAVSEAFSLAR